MLHEQICKAFFATTIHRITTFPACTCCWPESTANSTCKNCYQCVSRSSHSSRDTKTSIIQVTEERPFGSCTEIRGTPHGASSVCDSAVSLSSSFVGVHVHIHHLVQFRSAPSLSSAQLSASLRCNFTASSTSSNFRHSHLYFRLLTLYLIPGLENCHVRQRPCTPSYISCRTARYRHGSNDPYFPPVTFHHHSGQDVDRSAVHPSALAQQQLHPRCTFSWNNCYALQGTLRFSMMKSWPWTATRTFFSLWKSVHPVQRPDTRRVSDTSASSTGVTPRRRAAARTAAQPAVVGVVLHPLDLLHQGCSRLSLCPPSWRRRSTALPHTKIPPL